MTRCAIVFSVVWFAGCSGNAPQPTDPATAQKLGELEEIYSLISLYSDQAGKAPAAPKDLAQFENAYPLGYEQIRSGRAVVLWGARPNPNATAVLAYAKDVPGQGGAVLLQNGRVQQMTAAEFAAAPKAK